MKLPELRLESVSERDIDLLLLEELEVSESFQQWFLKALNQKCLEVCHVIGVWHSITHPQLGESDLIIKTSSTEDMSIAILVENKIDAAPQPEQANRYRQRGEDGKANGCWDDFCTAIVAPARYLEVKQNSDGYDSFVSYEKIQEWFGIQPDDPRSNFRARLLELAIDQQRRGYVPKADPVVTAFWTGYWEIATNEFPELQFPKPGPKPSESYWPEFRLIPNIPRDRIIIHKCNKGAVDLQINGAATSISQLRKFNGHLLDGDTTIEPTGKSVSFRQSVPKVDIRGIASEQISEIRTALRAVMRLSILSRAIKLCDESGP